MTEKTFSTPMGQIHYWTAEAPGRPWLVFLPGLTADCRLFDKQTQAFSPRFNCLVWDAPAHGASRPFALAFSMEDLTCWLHAILEREGIKKPLLVGQSMGGCIAQSYRKAYPESVAGLVAIDAPPLGRRYYTRAELWLLKHTKWMYRSIPWGLLQKCGVAGTSESPYGHSLMEKMLEGYQKEEYCALATHGYKLLAQAVEAYGESAAINEGGVLTAWGYISRNQQPFEKIYQNEVPPEYRVFRYPMQAKVRPIQHRGKEGQIPQK